MKIINLKAVDSTNKYAKENIEKLEDKTIISTEVQTAGYGRFNRSWVDLGNENIYMTFILKPSETICSNHAGLTQYLSVCLCKKLEEYGISPKIKWPNDVHISNKKVCGILAEAVIKSGKLKGIVLGIGINLNSKENHLSAIDRPATALNLECGRTINKKEFMQNLITEFFTNYDNFLEKGFSFIKDDYEMYSILQSKTEILKISVFKTVKEGHFAGFDNAGNLLLSTQNKIHKINMGELI